jgi:ubiquinone/menaquinone biosynthesis C-methylase UbiE
MEEIIIDGVQKSYYILRGKNYQFINNYANLLESSGEFTVVVLSKKAIVIKRIKCNSDSEGVPESFSELSFFNVGDWRTMRFLGKLFNVNEILPTINNTVLTDIQKIFELKKVYESSNPPSHSEFVGKGSTRESSRVDDLLRVLPDMKVENFLDVGCSEGKITTAVAKRLGLHQNGTFACDVVVPDYSRTLTGNDTLEGKATFRVCSQEKIPFGDNSMDLVSTFMSAHHFTNPVKMFHEIRRVLRKDGVLIMREHNAENINDVIFFDFVHLIHITIQFNEMTPEEFFTEFSHPGKHASYKTKKLWTKIISSLGFEVCRDYNSTDMMKSFYVSFRKV